MKKFVAMMMLVILTLSLGVAQAEMSMRTIMWDDSYCKVDEEGNRHYYVSVTRDSVNYSVIREVSRSVYYELLAEEEKDHEKYEHSWYVKTYRWTVNAAKDVADFVVFWK